MDRDKNGGLKNIKEINKKCALLFDSHSDVLDELLYFFTSEIPNSVPKKKRVQRISAKFLVDNGGLTKSGRDKRKRDDQGKVELEETNNIFQYVDYAEDAFKHFDKERKQLGISVEHFQFLMCSSFRISRDELETMVAPLVANRLMNCLTEES
ncbi:hypothetical protein FEM48_Zijuj07G0059200 [Ziziphus jujuba var. spinosa]|uniref:Uncharacterized protein n=1 Tax=Ziziphus jujuba var. spinosa TaxID=714518 RepID=A0A978V2V3_ZIZJJ|nr:hypothetical protein FEM48_Zijuj07G0059200 [Ziziphus jujuba var. spinosa]